VSNSFKEKKLSCRYRSGDSEAKPRSFYNEVLPCSTLYCRAVGFFSSTSFLEISYGILELVKNNGRMQLITSPRLSEDDVAAINQGYEAREKVYLRAFEREMFVPQNIDEKNRLNILANLIEHELLEIKIAVTKNPERSMYHEKIGLFYDGEGNVIAISGSNNESENAISENFESFQVFCNWKEGDKERVEICKNDFCDMWNDNQVDLEIFSFPDLPAKFIQTYQTSKLSPKAIKNPNLLEFEKMQEDDDKLFFHFPDKIAPREYQREAIKKFVKNDFECLFAMATGTGKTLTSLFAANELSCHRNLNEILIIVPLKDLVDQWEKDVRKYFSGNVISVRSGLDWKDKISDLAILKFLNNDTSHKTVVITTYDSFALNDQKIISALSENTLIIADEVHKFGATTYSQKLPESISFRIGLSATPKRPFDDRGTQAIFDYFCPSDTPYIFGIKEAIDAGMLCRYNYYPNIVPLTYDEMKSYEVLSEKISRVSAYTNSNNSDDKDREFLEQLLKERHRIVERAECKKEVFLSLMLAQIKKYKDKTIVFCPDGVDANGDDLLATYKKDLWGRLIAEKKFILMNEYVQGTERSVIEGFATGAIDILFAKQRLNEGIDIPSAKRAVFISSSTSEREFIQRRGRVLRKAPGKQLAEIFDFIVVPPDRNSQYASSIIESEIKRVMDFAETAENYAEIESILRSYL